MLWASCWHAPPPLQVVDVYLGLVLGRCLPLRRFLRRAWRWVPAAGAGRRRRAAFFFAQQRQPGVLEEAGFKVAHCRLAPLPALSVVVCVPTPAAAVPGPLPPRSATSPTATPPTPTAASSSVPSSSSSSAAPASVRTPASTIRAPAVRTIRWWSPVAWRRTWGEGGLPQNGRQWPAVVRVREDAPATRRGRWIMWLCQGVGGPGRWGAAIRVRA